MVSKEHKRGSGSAEPRPPGKTVDRGQALVKIACPGPRMRVLGARSMDELTLRNRSASAGDQERTEPRVDQFENEEFPLGPQFAVAPLSKLTCQVGGRRHMRNLVKHAFEGCTLKCVRRVEGGNVYCRSSGEWIESGSIFGNVDALSGIGIETIGRMAARALVKPKENTARWQFSQMGRERRRAGRRDRAARRHQRDGRMPSLEKPAG